jgi:hypothetical protein
MTWTGVSRIQHAVVHGFWKQCSFAMGFLNIAEGRALSRRFCVGMGGKKQYP